MSILFPSRRELCLDAKAQRKRFFFLKLDLIFLMSALVLSPPITGGPLLLFVFTTDDISLFWDVMAKDDDSWKEREGH